MATRGPSLFSNKEAEIANEAINQKNKGTLLLQLYKLLPLLLHKEGSKMLPGRENFTFCNEEAEIANKAINHKNKGTLLIKLCKLSPVLFLKERSKIL